jgi:hypothetical protein
MKLDAWMLLAEPFVRLVPLFPVRGQIDVLLVRLPGFSGIGNEGGEMLGGVLHRGGAIRTARIVVIEHAKIGARLRP